MKKKILGLLMCLVLVGGTLAGCGSKEGLKGTVKPATFEELKTATETTYKDIESGKFGVNVNADLTMGAEDESMTLKGTVDMSISMDKDTAYVVIKAEGFDDMLDLDNIELYMDLENEVTYTCQDGEWVVTEDASIEDLLGEYGISMDTEDTPEIKFDEDLKVETTKDGYVVKKTLTGTELIDMLSGEEAEEDEMGLEMFAAIFEKLTVDVEASFNADKVLNGIDLKITADNIDMGNGASIDGNIKLSVDMNDINKCEVTIPQNVLDAAE